MNRNPHLNRSLLGDPDSIEARKLGELGADGVTLIVAPHPDDESLGCGGLIALLRDLGRQVHVLFVSDGSASHPNSLKFRGEKLTQLRHREALSALEILGVNEAATTFLNLPDSRVPNTWQEGFTEAVTAVGKILSEIRPTSVFTPWRRDVHHDHIATTAIIHKAVEQMENPPRVIEYPVWVWDAESHDKAPTDGEMIAWKLDVSGVRDRKTKAVFAHVSQTTDLIDDDPGGFVLSADQISRYTGDHEIFFEPKPPAEDSTLTPSYFEGMYEREEDPWEFATSEYEAGKYRETIATLPRGRYRNVLELGCSIGVLTEMLAGQSDEILGIDASKSAIERAKTRCGKLGNVTLAVGFVPQDWPPGEFDLIVISEVAYYLSAGDLTKLFDCVVKSLSPDGEVVMVHWTPFVASYPQTGDAVHEYAISRPELLQVCGKRMETYRIDVLRKARDQQASASL